MRPALSGQDRPIDGRWLGSTADGVRSRHFHRCETSPGDGRVLPGRKGAAAGVALEEGHADDLPSAVFQALCSLEMVEVGAGEPFAAGVLQPFTVRPARGKREKAAMALDGRRRLLALATPR